MKDPFRSHRSNVKKVKVVCSFKGKFQRCPPSGRLRYTGGETRIIWVERKIGFSALKSKILELLLCPNNDFPFCIIYQLQVKGNDAPLVMVSSDNDVRDMVSEYEKLKLLGKPTRLWIYVCNDNVYSYKQAKGNNISAKCVNIENCGSGFELSCQSSKRFGGKNDGFESNATTNIAAFISNNRAATVSAPSSQLIAGPQLQKHSVDMNSMPTGSDAKHELNSNHLARLSNLDRENIRPLSSNFNSVKTSFAPLSYSSQLVGSAYATKSSNGSHWAWNGLRSTIHNSRFNATDVRNQRICSCFICCHWNDPTETGNHRKLRLEGMPCVGKFCPGLHSISNISEQGQPIRLYYTGSWKPQSDDHDDTQDAKPVNATNISRSNGQLNSTNIMELECIGKPSDTELDAISFRNHCGIAHATGGLVSSGDLSFCNLPLSSYKEAEYLVHSSPTIKTVAEALAKLDIKLIDETNEEHLTRGPQVEVSNGDEYDSSYQEAAKLKKDEELKKEMQEGHPSSLRITNKKTDTKESVKSSQANGCITMDLGGFYSRLASKGLQTIKSSDIEYFKELGSGTYGTVFYGKWKGSDVAIKKLKSSCLAEGAAEQDRLLANFWKEAHILGQLRHPCVVAFYGVVTDGPLTNLATVTEYMVNGSLKQFLRRKDRTIDRRKRLIIAMDAAFGMEYLHEKKIVHFDLKSHNLLVNMKDTQRPVCKIGDLGLSKTRKRTMVSGGVRGTITWMAPELLNSKKDMVTEKVDVYSFGIVMWELLTGEEPYANMRPEKIIDGIIKGDLRPEIPSWCDPSWRSLMERCWSSDPASRPSFSKIAKELRTMAATMNIK